MRKFISGFAALFFLLMLFGCGAANLAPSINRPVQQFSMKAGNWNLSATSSTNPNSNQFLIGGHLEQRGNTVTGILHIASSRCFKVDKDIAISGSVDDAGANLTSLSVDHQVLRIALIGHDDTMVGNYSFSGGCSDGDEGSVTGNLGPTVSGIWNATDTALNQSVSGVNLAIAQSATANGHGVYPLSGALAFSASPCQVSGRITSGYVAGNIVVINAETQEGTGNTGSLRMEGDFAPGKSPSIVGAYSYGAGACKDRAGVLTFTP